MIFSSHKLNMLLSSLDKNSEPKSLRMIASEMGISAGYLALLRNGSKTNPGPQTIAKLSRYFKVNPDSFYEDEQDTARFTATNISLKTTLQLCDEFISTGSAHQALRVLDTLINDRYQDLLDANILDQTKILRAVGMARMGNVDVALHQINLYVDDSRVNSHLQTFAFYHRARIYYQTGHFNLAIEDATRSLENASELSDHELLKNVHYSLGVYHGRMARYALSIFHYEKARELVEDKDNIEYANILLGLGQTYVLMNEPEYAERNLIAAQSLYEKNSNRQGVANALHNRSRCMYLLRDNAGAIRILYQALEEHQQAESLRGIAYDYLELARCHIQLQEYDKAQDFSMRASTTFEMVNDEGQVARSKLVQIEAIMLGGKEHTLSTEELSKIKQSFESRGWGRECVKIQRIMALILEKNGETAKALELFKHIAFHYEEILDRKLATD